MKRAEGKHREKIRVPDSNREKKGEVPKCMGGESGWQPRKEEGALSYVQGKASTII